MKKELEVMIILQVTWFNLWKNGPEHKQSSRSKIQSSSFKTGSFFKPSVIKRKFFQKGWQRMITFRFYDLCTVRIAHKDHGRLQVLLQPCKKERYTLVATCFRINRVCQRITICSSRQGTKGSSLFR